MINIRGRFDRRRFNKLRFYRFGIASALVLFGMLAAIGLSSCAANALPLFHDRYIGFSVGKPAGWGINYLNGTISVQKDPSGKTTALVYPVRLKEDQSADQALSEYAAILGDVFQKADGNLQASPQGGSGDHAVMALSGEYKGAAIQGELRANRKGRDLLITGGWAPQADWSAQKSTILAVGQSYEKRPAAFLKLSRATGGGDTMGGATTTYQFALPEGWHVSGVTFRGIDLSLDAVTGVSFAYLTNGIGTVTTDQWIDFVFQGVGYTDIKYLAEQPLGQQSDAMGMGWQMVAKEYEATFKGTRVRGVATGAVSNIGFGYGYGSYSGMISLRQSTVSKWDEFSAITAAIQESIKITDAKAGQSLILPKNNPLDSSSVMGSWEYRNQVQDRASAKWSEAVMGYENVHSPTTGQTYQAPLNSWNATGSDGAGYYRPLPGGGQEKLDLDNP